MKVESHHLLGIVKSALIELGISYKDVEISAMYKINTEWRVNFSFIKDVVYPPKKETGALAVNAETGEVRYVGLDRAW